MLDFKVGGFGTSSSSTRELSSNSTDGPMGLGLRQPGHHAEEENVCVRSRRGRRGEDEGGREGGNTHGSVIFCSKRWFLKNLSELFVCKHPQMRLAGCLFLNRKKGGSEHLQSYNENLYSSNKCFLTSHWIGSFAASWE